jgi:ubiquitin-like 1-activating enzyme E1 A
VAEASVAVLQEMNPLVKVSALPGTPQSFLTPDRLENYSVLLLVGQSAHIVQQADKVCMAVGIPLYAAVSRGLYGWAFANLHTHTYTIDVSYIVDT